MRALLLFAILPLVGCDTLYELAGGAVNTVCRNTDTGSRQAAIDELNRGINQEADPDQIALSITCSSNGEVLIAR